MPFQPQLEFPWPLLRTILSGSSILDLPRLRLANAEDASELIRAYGFDENNQEDINLLWSCYDRALDFLEKTLRDPEHLLAPLLFHSRNSLSSIRELLIWASDPHASERQIWACALLRVMHALIHLNYDPRLQFFDQAQNKIFQRIESHLFTDPQTGILYLGALDSPQRIKILFYKKKDRKDKDREIIKLLHKANQSVEDIYDRLGYRLVTETKLDAVRAVAYLVQKNIISVPNIQPGRSRNRLVDLVRLEKEIHVLETWLARKNMTDAFLAKVYRRIERRMSPHLLSFSRINPFTSEHYHAIQFTCRTLVRLPPATPRTPSQFVFFPFEVQIMDMQSYADSVFGKRDLCG